MRWFVILVALALLPGRARADDAPFAQYQYSRETGQIRITTGFMERTQDLSARQPALEKNGIVVLESNAPRTFLRRERIGSHSVETAIFIAPPAGHGEGGASSQVDLRVVMDRDTIVSCPLSHAAIGLDQIAIDPARRYVTLLGYERLLHFAGFEAQRLIDEDWLERRADEIRTSICDTK